MWIFQAHFQQSDVENIPNGLSPNCNKMGLGTERHVGPVHLESCFLLKLWKEADCYGYEQLGLLLHTPGWTEGSQEANRGWGGPHCTQFSSRFLYRLVAEEWIPSYSHWASPWPASSVLQYALGCWNPYNLMCSSSLRFSYNKPWEPAGWTPTPPFTAGLLSEGALYQPKFSPLKLGSAKGVFYNNA